MAAGGDEGTVDQTVYIFDGNATIEAAVAGNRCAIEEKDAVGTGRIEIVEVLLTCPRRLVQFEC